MANVIKLKRGSGSDPSASDLAIGELAIRTDTGKIFLKKDNGNIAEVSGGGGLSDGDKGDITVSNSGDTLTIDSGVIDNANISSSAAIAGTKINPSFTSNVTISNTHPQIFLTDTDNNSDYKLQNLNGVFGVRDETNSATRFSIASDGTIDVIGNLDVGAGLDVTGNITVTGTVDGRDVATDGTKLDTVETNAKDDQTAAEIKTLLNSNGIVNAQVDASAAIALSKLATGTFPTGLKINTDNILTGAVTTGKIATGTIINGDISTTAAIAGTKISPDFGSQEITTTGVINGKDLILTDTHPSITYTDSDGNPDYLLKVNHGWFKIHDATNDEDRLTVNSNGHIDIHGNLDCLAGLDVTGTLTQSKSSTDTNFYVKSLPAAESGLYVQNPNTTNGTYSSIGIISKNSASTDQSASIVSKSVSGGYRPEVYITQRTNANANTAAIFIDSSGSVQLNYDGSSRIISTSGGASIAGNITVTGTVDGVDIAALNTAAARKDGSNMGTANLRTDDADFVVQDSTDGVTNFIWRDHSASKLYLGTDAAVVTPRSHVIPSVDSTYNLGSDGIRWAYIYGDTISGNLYGNGSNITVLNASQLTSGTVAAARLDTATTQSAGNNSTKIATTAYADTAISNLVDSSPGTLNTLNELAAALGDDANFSTTVTNSIATKLPLAGGTMSGAINLNSNNITNGGTITGTFVGNITGNVTGNTSGSSGSCTGNAATATTATNTVVGLGSADSTFFPVFTDNNGSSQALRVDGSLGYNPSTNVLTAGTFSGSGASLTSLNASNISSGTIPNARLATTVNVTALTATTTTVTTSNATSFVGSGDLLTSLRANQLSGTVPTARLGSGTASSSTFLRGDNTWSSAADSTKLPLAGGSLSGALTGTSATFSGNVTTGQQLTVSGAEPRLVFTDTDNNPDFTIWANAQAFKITDETNSTTRLTINSSGNATFSGSVTATGGFSGSGANITSLNASNISSGTIAAARVATLNQNTSGTAALATSVTVTANNGNNENVYLAFVDSSAGGTQGIETDGALSYNPSTNALTTTEFIGGLTGNASGSSGSCTGNAATATVLATARTIAGVSFDGSANISLNNNAITNGAGYVTSNTQLSNEQVQDIVGAMFSGNSESNITATYQDSDGTIDLAATNTTYSVGDGGLTQNNFTNTLKSKLDGIESSATADQTASEILTLIKTVDGSGSGLNADLFDGLGSSQFLRSDAADTASGDITFSGGAGAVSIAADSDIRLTNGDWTGNSTKIQHHSNYLYIQGGSGTYGIIFRDHAGTNRWAFRDSGHLVPYADSTYDIGLTGTRVRNIYADTLYGAGSNITALNASNISSGTIAAARLPNHSAALLTSGTIPSARVPTLNQNTTGSAGSFTAGNASNLNSGTVNTARLPATYTKAAQVVVQSTGAGNDVKLDAADHIIFEAGEEEDGSIYFRGNSGSDSYRFSKGGQTTHEGFLSFESLSADRTYTFPNSTGTIALTSDLSNYLTSNAADTFSGDLTSSGSARILLKKTDNNASDHIIFYNGTTRIGEIGCEDTTWLRINQETAKNIYTPRYIRADAGFFVDGTSKGINGSGNFTGGTIAGASDYTSLIRSNADSNVSGHTEWQDNYQVRLGNGADMRLYHNASNSYIDNYLGHIYIRNAGSNDNGNIYLQARDGEHSIICEDDNKVRLYFNHVETFRTNGTTSNLSKHFYPWSNNAYDLGSTSSRWRNLYINDLNLSNEGGKNTVDGTWGDWTLQEGEDNIFMINNRSGKKFKMLLQEVS